MNDQPAPKRECGGCTLCCKLLPVPQVQKLAGEKCRFQSRTGCRVHGFRTMPTACALWSCSWLLNPEGKAAGLRRPDRGHYVVDPLPDFVSTRNNETGEITAKIPVIQVWIDPRYPDAHRDRALREFLDARGQEGFAALIRYNNVDAFALFPPSMTDDGQWHEVTGAQMSFHVEHQHTRAEIEAVLRERG